MYRCQACQGTGLNEYHSEKALALDEGCKGAGKKKKKIQTKSIAASSNKQIGMLVSYLIVYEMCIS